MLHFTKYIHILYLPQMHKLTQLKFCIVFPWQRYFQAWTHSDISHSSAAKQQQSILCMVLCIAYSDAGQFIACVCQISLVYVSLRKRYESTLSYFWLTLVCKGAKIRNRYNQVPHLTRESDKLTDRHHKQEPAGDHKAHINRHAQRHSKYKTEKT